MKDKKLFLIDAYALIYRAYYAFIKNPIINSKGFDTSAIMGFLNSIFDLLKREKPDYFAVAFDVGGSVDRYEIYEEYKANRDSTPEPILDSVPIIHEILDALGIKTLQLSGYEADDIIGTVAKQAEKEGLKTYMVTPDKDFAQLVSENIFLYKPARFGGGIEIWGIDEVKNKFEINHPLQVIDFLGMMGDSVDNIPGIPGVGEKTAKKFLKEYGSMEELYKNLEDIKGKLKEKISSNKELGLLSKKLATIITDVPIEYSIEELKISNSNSEKVLSIFNELEFKRLKENYLKLFGKSENQESHQSLELDFKLENENKTFSQKVESKMGIELLINKMLSKKSYAIDYKFEKDYSFISFCSNNEVSYYIEFEYSELYNILNTLKDLFESKSLKIIYNHKVFLKELKKNNINFNNNFFDIKIANYLADSSRRDDLESIIKTNLNIESTEFRVNSKVVLINKLFNILENDLIKHNLIDLFYDLEMPLSNVLMQMEYSGVKLDEKLIYEIKVQFQENLNQLENYIFNFCKKTFNLASPKQLGEILFDDLKIESNPKKTKTGQYSTSEETLSKLSKKHEIVTKILEWRSLQKLMSTYINALPEQVDIKTKKIHSIFNQTNTSTGRLSSNNPNLQNIPIRTNNGKLIRKAFTSSDNNSVLISADYSQIELRVIASMSGDENMINAFNNNEDIHASTAAKVFNIEIGKVTKEQRSHAKIVNFGIIYGVSAFGLSNQTNLNRSESKLIIDNYYSSYPALKEFMTNQINFARENGFVQTILGRKRFLNDINSRNGMVRSSAERNAINTPVQGSAADIIKLSMIKINEELKKHSLKSKLILQVHDELVFDVPQEEVDLIKKIIIENMENAYKLKVPLIVDLGIGNNWLEAH
jgi:DNA polymerase-1